METPKQMKINLGGMHPLGSAGSIRESPIGHLNSMKEAISQRRKIRASKAKMIGNDADKSLGLDQGPQINLDPGDTLG